MALALYFQGLILKEFYLRNDGSINIAWKGCKSIGCQTHHVTLNYGLDLRFSLQFDLICDF